MEQVGREFESAECSVEGILTLQGAPDRPAPPRDLVVIDLRAPGSIDQ